MGREVRASGGHRTARAAAAVALAAIALLGCARVRSIIHPPVSAPPPDAPVVAYVVQPGDTLERIAAWHGVRAGQIAEGNDIEPGDRLRPGRTLRIPRRSLPTHTVEAGDSITKLAIAYGVEPEAIAHLNEIENPNRILVGSLLRLPATARARSAAPGLPAAAAAAPRPAATPSPREPSAAAAANDSAGVDAALARASTAFDAADFDGALSAAAQAREQLGAAPQGEDRRRLARSHLIAGMAQVALGRDAEARTSFRQALANDAAIELDPARVSPKVISAFQEARGGQPTR